MVKTYFVLTKPGIIFGNAITMIAGFFLASKGSVDFALLFFSLIGLSLIIASGCVFNNYLDRHHDAKMERTKNRALVKGDVPLKKAIVFAIALCVVGVSLMITMVNFLSGVIAFFGFVIYVALYSPLKYKTLYGTLIGSVAGAVPPVVGYTAVANQLDLAAFILFLIVVFWQMPHFYAIAIYRLEDYKAASVPVLPVKKGIRTTKVHMLLFVIAFILATALLTVFGYTESIYLLVVGALGLGWLWLSIQGFRCKDDKLWARKMFLYSLITIMVVSIEISIDYWTKI